MSKLKTTKTGLSRETADRFECFFVGENLRAVMTFTQDEAVDADATATFDLLNAQTNEIDITGTVADTVLEIPAAAITAAGIYYLEVTVTYTAGDIRKLRYKIQAFD